MPEPTTPVTFPPAFLWGAAMCGNGFVWRGSEMTVRRASEGGLQLAEK